MTEHTTRVTVLNEYLYGEQDTLTGWQEWLIEMFDKVPPEYRDIAVLEIDGSGESASTILYYDRPETDDERKARRQLEHARAAESERLAARHLAEARERRERLAQEETT